MRKKCHSFVRQCWYTITSRIFTLFEFNFWHVFEQQQISALSKHNSTKNQYWSFYSDHTCHHKNSYYSLRQLYQLVFIPLLQVYQPILCFFLLPSTNSNHIVLILASLLKFYFVLREKPTRYVSLWISWFGIAFWVFSYILITLNTWW